MGLAQLGCVFSSEEAQGRDRSGQEQTVDTYYKLLLDSRKLLPQDEVNRVGMN